MISYMYIAPWEGHTTPFDVNTKSLSLFTKFALKSDLYTFFHVSPYVYSPRQGQRASGPVDAHLTPGPGIYFNAFIHVYSLRARADYPLGTNVDVNRNKYRSNFSEVDVAPAKNDKVNKVEKLQKLIAGLNPNHMHIFKPWKKRCAKLHKDRHEIV